MSQIEQEERIADLEAQKNRHESLESILKGRPTSFLDVTPTKHIPFSRNPHFVGRGKELQIIHDSLSIHNASQSSPVAGQRALVLHGLGGMGKTETALEYAYRSMDSFDSILWIAAETEQKADTSFSEISVWLNMPRPQSQADVRPRDEVLKRLNTTDSTWLLVFDNAPDKDTRLLRDFWPNGKAGSILVTTRNACLSREYSIPVDICLGPIDEEASVQILTGRLTDSLTEKSYDQARAICRQLGHFPLALSQIAGYLTESGCDLHDFPDTYKDFANLSELHAASNPGSTTGYSHNLSTVWSMTMTLLEKKSTTAIQTLSLLAFLDPDGMSAFRSPLLNLDGINFLGH